MKKYLTITYINKPDQVIQYTDFVDGFGVKIQQAEIERQQAAGNEAFTLHYDIDQGAEFLHDAFNHGILAKAQATLGAAHRYLKAHNRNDESRFVERGYVQSVRG